LLDDARTRPQVPSSTVTRTPLTVTRSRIAWPATFPPFAFAAWNVVEWNKSDMAALAQTLASATI
jgi:hypothetical protein